MTQPFPSPLSIYISYPTYCQYIISSAIYLFYRNMSYCPYFSSTFYPLTAILILLAGFSACGGSLQRHAPLRRSAIIAFYHIGNSEDFPIWKKSGTLRFRPACCYISNLYIVVVSYSLSGPKTADGKDGLFAVSG